MTVQSASDVPTEVLKQGWLEQVARTRDTDLRAHRVALTYHYYARMLDKCINDEAAVWERIDRSKPVGKSNANWFNYATWATITINRDIGPRRAPLVSSRFIPQSIRRSLTPTLMHLRAADGQRVSRALSWGQLLVFLSTTYLFHDVFCKHDIKAPRDTEPIGLEHGGIREPSPVPKEETVKTILELSRWGSQEYVGLARHLMVIFRALKGYELAHTEHLRGVESPPNAEPWPFDLTDTVRSRLYLRANLMITAVEQDVVQEAVRQVIDHVPSLAMSRLTDRVARWGERYLGVPREITGLQLPFRMERGAELMRSLWARVMTDQVLVLTLPAETLRLGRDIPPLDYSRPYVPVELADLSAVPEIGCDQSRSGAETTGLLMRQDLLELARLVESFDRSRGGGHGSAAHDWRRYDERMNWAVTMLRTRQHDMSLFWCPYSAEDQLRIVNGELPKRVGDPTEYEVQAPVGGFPPAP